MQLTDEQRQHGIAILIGVGIALAGALVLYIISDPASFNQALTTPCNLPECL